jgi:hypothetical protein
MHREQGKKHVPALSSLNTCAECIRNPVMKDRWDECWIYDANDKAIIEEEEVIVYDKRKT